MDLANLIIAGLLFYIPFYFSKKAGTQFFRLLYSFFGIYMILTMGFINPLYNAKFLVGLGLLIPQIRFIILFTQDTSFTIKMMSANAYYFFITIYYKILRFIQWIESTIRMAKIFFNTFSFNKEDYSEQEQSSKQYYEYEQKRENFYEEAKREFQYEQEEAKADYGEFQRFFSDSAYVVLGVSADDDYKTIQKVYRGLVREYHPDLNPDNVKLYTEITQNINDAWDKVKSWKK